MEIEEARARAVAAKDAGDLEEAARFWSVCYSLDKNALSTLIEYVATLQKLRRFDEVETIFSERPQGDFLNKGVALHAARNAFLSGNWTVAVERWKIILSVLPHHYEAHLKLAESHAHSGRHGDARRALARASVAGAGRIDPEIHRVSALVALGCGEANRSAGLWETYFQSAEPQPATRLAYATALIQCGRRQDAVSILRTTQGRTGERVKALWQVARHRSGPDDGNVGTALASSDDAVTEALRALTELLPETVEPRRLLAERFIASGLIAPAVEQLKKTNWITGWLKLFATQPADPVIAAGISRELITDGKVREAAALLTAMLLMVPDSFELLAADAEIAEAEGNWVRAVAQWSRYLRTQPHDHLALGRRITACINSGSFEKAIQYKEDAQGIIPEYALSIINAQLEKTRGNWDLVQEYLNEISKNISILDHAQRISARNILIDMILHNGHVAQFSPLILEFQSHNELSSDTDVLTAIFEIARENMVAAVKQVHNLASASNVERRQLVDLISLLVRSIPTEVACEIAIAVVRSLNLTWLLLEFGKRIAETQFYRYASAIFEQALANEERKGRRAHVLLAWARAAYRYGNAEEVIRCCRKALQFLPGHKDTLELLLITYQNLDEWKHGDAVATEISKNDTLESGIIVARYLLKRGKFKEARDLAIQLSWTADLRLMHILADAAQARLRFDDETYYRGQILQARPHPEAFVAYGRALIAKGDPQSAVRAFEAALAEDPFSYAAYSELAQIAPHLSTRYREPLANIGSIAERLKFRVQVLIGENSLSSALELIEQAPIDLVDQKYSVRILRAFILRHLGRLHEAEKAYNILLKNNIRSARVIRDAALVLCDLERYREAEILLSEHSHAFTFGTSRSLFANVKREIALGKRDIASIWTTYQEETVVRALTRLDNHVKYISEIESIKPPEKLLFCASYGIGDEVRWSTVYADIAIHHPGAIITCEPRLHELFRRSFPTLEFVPARRRMREQLSFEMYQDYLNLPDRSLFALFDEASWKIAKAVGNVAMVSDALAAYRNSLEKFRHSEITLQADRSRRIRWRSKLRQLPEGVNVGISWRSSIQNATRNVHYTELHEWAPIFAVPGVNFINIQYDDPTLEIAAAKAEFEVDIVDFPEIDLKNDLDDMAALLVELDLVIAPCISTAELAGAMGVHTLLMSNSPVMKWRVRLDGTDLWFKNLRCIFGNTMFDKASLIDATATELANFVASVAGKPAP